MKAMYISLGLLGHDGRQRELLDVLSNISEVDVIAPSLAGDVENNSKYSLSINSRNERTGVIFYIKLLFMAVKYSYTKKYDFIFIDDYQASVIGLLLSILHGNKIIVTDCREFYYKRNMPGLGKWLVRAEKLLIKKSDIVIVANSYRANMMRILYDIKMPLVFENLREIILNTSRNFDKKQDNIYRLVSTGGCSLERGTLELVRAVGKSSDVSLIVVGKGHERDYKRIMEEIELHDITNVNIIDRVPFKNLCEILMSCDGGIVEYHMNDLNNYFCASGKVYEYLSIGMPIITTSNPPLSDFLSKNNCGVVAVNWEEGIHKFKSDYKRLKKTAVSLSESVDSLSHRKVFSINLIDVLKDLLAEKNI